MRRFRLALLIATASLLGPMTAQSASAITLESAAQSSGQLFRSVESFWSQEVGTLGGRYRPAKLKLFSAPIRGACTVQATLSGPFYCTVTETVYLDQTFVQQLIQRDQQDANLALGFVVAHEVAHHIQNVIGTTSSMDQSRANSTAELGQRLFTTFELQADCYAGLWAHWAAARGAIKIPANVSVTLDAIATTSQDWQVHLSAGQEMLDPLSQGSAAQRFKWFHRGLDSGNFNDCDTFGAEAAGNL